MQIILSHNIHNKSSLFLHNPKFYSKILKQDMIVSLKAPQPNGQVVASLFSVISNNNKRKALYNTYSLL